MFNIKIQQKQINSKMLADMIPCPHNKFKITNVVACKMSCRRYVSKNNEYLLCGAVGSNEVLKTPSQRKHPALWEVFGEAERYWMVGAYGKPKG